jgi:hypothetical protein
LAEASEARFRAGLLAGFALGLLSFISECGFGGIRRSAPISCLVFFRFSRLMLMSSLRFTGKILPPGFTLDLENYPTLKIWDHEKRADVGTMDISIKGTDITVLVNHTAPIDDNLERESFRNVNDAVQGVIAESW